MMSEEYPRAEVREVNGELVLYDPVGCAVARAVAKHNCLNTFKHQAERVAHFRNRASELMRSPEEVVIVLANVDTPLGREIADALMPGHDWQQYRERGQIPFARGLAMRNGIQGFLDVVDHDAAAKLREADCLSVVVVDCGVAEVFDAA
jgi:hypothetical protein